MLTEDQLWEIFNADVSAASGPDKAKGGVMAMARAVRAEALEEAAQFCDALRLHQAAEAVRARTTTMSLIHESIRDTAEGLAQELRDLKAR